MIVASCYVVIHWYVVPPLGSIHLYQLSLFHTMWCNGDYSFLSGDVTVPEGSNLILEAWPAYTGHAAAAYCSHHHYPTGHLACSPPTIQPWLGRFGLSCVGELKMCQRSAISTWWHYQSWGPDVALRTGDIFLLPGLGRSHHMPWQVPEEVWWLWRKRTNVQT